MPLVYTLAKALEFVQEQEASVLQTLSVSAQI